MNAAARALLRSFDELSHTDQHEVAVEILRRVFPLEPGELSDAALISAADGLFRELDAREAADTGPSPRY